MKPFTIRDIDCEEILKCDDGDLILRHCKGDRLFLYYEKIGKPTKVEFNLRLSKKLITKLRKEYFKS